MNTELEKLYSSGHADDFSLGKYIALKTGKIFNTRDSMEEEKKLAEKINKIDPKGKWTVPYYGSCFINVEQTRPNDNIYKCNKYNHIIQLKDKSFFNTKLRTVPSSFM